MTNPYEQHPYDEYDRVTGESRARLSAKNFVAPLPKPAPLTVDSPGWMVQAQPLDLARGWQTLDGAQEHTSAMDRAKALRVRLLPFVLLWALLAVIVGVVVMFVAQNAPGAALGGLLVFTALTAATYVKLNGQDYAHSREGTERLKVVTAADLAREQMRNEQEMRRLAVDFYMKQLKGNGR